MPDPGAGTSELAARSEGFAGRAALLAELLPPIFLLLLCVPVIFWRLGDYSLVNGDEGFYHYVSRRMVETGEWWTVQFNWQERIYDTLTHAPLFLWIKALVIAVLGDGYVSMRLPSASFAALSVLATYGLVARVANRRAALLAGLVQLTTFQFVFLHSARTGEMEPATALALTLAAFFYLDALERGRSFVPHHACLAVLVNLKLGLVVLPLLAELAWFALDRPARRRFGEWLRLGLWIAPFALAWHAVQLVRHWGELSGVGARLLSQTGGRRLDLLGQIGFYTRHLVFGASPWVFLYPVAMAAVLLGAPPRERRRWQVLALYPTALLGFFLAIGLAHPWYTMPAIPFFSAFVGRCLDQLTRRTPRGPLRLALAAALALGVCVAVPIWELNPFAERALALGAAPEWRDLAGLGPWIALPLLTVLLVLALTALARARSPLALAAPVTLGLLLFAAVRVAAPHRHLPHVSQMELLRREIDAAAGTERPPRPPFVLHEGGILKARFYFGDEFAIHLPPRRLRRRGAHFVLRPRPAGAVGPTSFGGGPPGPTS